MISEAQGASATDTDAPAGVIVEIREVQESPFMIKDTVEKCHVSIPQEAQLAQWQYFPATDTDGH